MKKVPQHWKKSSASNQTNTCVEVRADLGAIRDSKAPHVGELAASAAELARWIKQSE